MARKNKFRLVTFIEVMTPTDDGEYDYDDLDGGPFGFKDIIVATEDEARHIWEKTPLSWKKEHKAWKAREDKKRAAKKAKALKKKA